MRDRNINHYIHRERDKEKERDKRNKKFQGKTVYMNEETLFFFFIGKLYMFLMGFEPTILRSSHTCLSKKCHV